MSISYFNRSLDVKGWTCPDPHVSGADISFRREYHVFIKIFWLKYIAGDIFCFTQFYMTVQYIAYFEMPFIRILVYS